MIRSINIPKRLAEGITSKLDFDYSCNRGHAFGEIYVHGIANEIIASNIDPIKFSLINNYQHPSIQRIAKVRGRNRELDFAIEERIGNAVLFAAEVKWAGSSHCSPDKVLLDLIRLQIVANSNKSIECALIISGTKNDMKKLFSNSIFRINTDRLLIYPETSQPKNRISGRFRKFNLTKNKNHQKQIDSILKPAKTRNFVGGFPNEIRTNLTLTKLSNLEDGRFQTLVWRIQGV